MEGTPRYRVIGNHLSPYVRKVLVCLALKGLDYEIDPIASVRIVDGRDQLADIRAALGL